MNEYSSHLNHTFFKKSMSEGIKMGLSSIKSVLNTFNNPQKTFKTVHIAGTNGKGSTARILSTCLMNSELKTGLFTSPHIKAVNERLQINNAPIKTELFKAILDDIEEVFLQLKNKNHLISLTYFEICTIAAFIWFSRENVDIAVIETGMGGRLDSTNCIFSPYVIITGIAKDHEKYLGNTLNDIALEKAAIIHKNAKVILAPLKNKIKDIIVAKKANNIFYNYERTLKSNNSFSCEKLNTGEYKYRSSGFLNQLKFKLSLKGYYQGYNAASALKALEMINPPKLSKDRIVQSLKNVSWQGRLHIIHNNPLLIFDAAHNVDAIKKLKKEFINEKGLICIAGFCEDKNYKSAIKIISEFTEKVFLVALNNKRTFNPEKTVRYMLDNNIKNVEYAKSFNTTISYLRKNKKKILVCGSFYLLNEAYNWVEKNLLELGV